MMPLNATECIRFGWSSFTARPWYLIGTLILLYIPNLLVSVIESNTHGALYALLVPLGFVVNILVGIAIVSFVLKAHEDVQLVSLQDARRKIDTQLVLNYVAAWVLQILIIVGGLILLIVPGIIFMLMFSQTLFLVVDRRLGPIEALKESKRITTGNKGGLFRLLLLSVCVVMLGLVCLVVGLLAAIPVVVLAQVHAYRLLEGHASAIISAEPSTPMVV